MLIIDWNKYDEKYIYAAMDSDGYVWIYTKRPQISVRFKEWNEQEKDEPLLIHKGVIGSKNDEWVNSLTWRKRPPTAQY